MKIFLQKSVSYYKNNKGQKTSFSIIKGNDTKINKIKGVSIGSDSSKFNLKHTRLIPNYVKKKIYLKENKFSLNKSDVLELLSDSYIKKNKENKGNKMIEIKPKNKKSLNISKIDNFKPVKSESRPVEPIPNRFGSKPVEVKPVRFGSKPVEFKPVKSESRPVEVKPVRFGSRPVESSTVRLEPKPVKSKLDKPKPVKSKLDKPKPVKSKLDKSKPVKSKQVKPKLDKPKSVKSKIDKP